MTFFNLVCHLCKLELHLLCKFSSQSKSFKPHRSARADVSRHRDMKAHHNLGKGSLIGNTAPKVTLCYIQRTPISSIRQAVGDFLTVLFFSLMKTS